MNDDGFKHVARKVRKSKKIIHIRAYFPFDKPKMIQYNTSCSQRKWALAGLQMYSRGRRGAPAKGVGRETGARVQIPPSALIFN